MKKPTKNLGVEDSCEMEDGSSQKLFEPADHLRNTATWTWSLHFTRYRRKQSLTVNLHNASSTRKACRTCGRGGRLQPAQWRGKVTNGTSISLCRVSSLQLGLRAYHTSLAPWASADSRISQRRGKWAVRKLSQVECSTNTQQTDRQTLSWQTHGRHFSALESITGCSIALFGCSLCRLICIVKLWQVSVSHQPQQERGMDSMSMVVTQRDTTPTDSHIAWV